MKKIFAGGYKLLTVLFAVLLCTLSAFLVACDAPQSDVEQRSDLARIYLWGYSSLCKVDG